MIVDLVIAIVIARYLRKALQTATKLPKWDKVFNYIFYGAIGLLVIQVTVHPLEAITTWLAHGLMLYLVYILYTEQELKASRPVLLAIAPYVILSLFEDVAKLTAENRYSSWKGFVDLATIFSVIWMLTMWFIINKQKKALDKAKVKAEEEEEQKKQVISLNDQLELQVSERTAELTKQKEELQDALDELKSTQTQLIQAEKMASLGQLTAGIAHEIQNPLNFVNNFSDVNSELIEEMQEQINNRNFEEVRLIATDIKENEEKINFHGKRADAIVKGMLQHSRKNTGQKELTDINSLADEYLRLSYHGLRAKDKSFNATIKTNFDENIEKIDIVPQDIGRVFLNLINNAFYAVSEKKKLLPEHYEPTVTVSTNKIGNKISITVKDNGNGIPQSVKDKIFQPFFTTKPTGQGTGLGLSLSYDIIKAHGGDLEVETKENIGSEFSISLPMKEV